jgi:hypothetical protein
MKIGRRLVVPYLAARVQFQAKATGTICTGAAIRAERTHLDPEHSSMSFGETGEALE